MIKSEINKNMKLFILGYKGRHVVNYMPFNIPYSNILVPMI